MPRATQFPLGSIGVAAALLVPAGLLGGLGLASGGFFPDSVSVAAVAVILMFSVRAVSSRAPFAGVSVPFSAVAVALVGFAVWTLASGSWSGAPARAAFEYDRTLLYIGVFVLTGVLGRAAARARVLLYGLAAVSAAVSIAAAATWLLPDVFPVVSDIGRQRLSWPTSYWNATGLIAALAVVWTISLSCLATERAFVRVLAAVAAPLPAATLIFTVSRGASAVAALGIVVAVLTIRSSATPGGVLALAPAIALSVVIALGVNGLNVDKPAGHALSVGHRAGVLLGLLSLAAGALRLALVPLDARLGARRVTWNRTRVRAAVAAAIAVLIVAFLAVDGPGRVHAALHQFVAPETQSVGGTLPARQRLTRLGSNGRVQQWHVAFVDGFRRHPLDGTGAGTYATLWTRFAPTFRRVLDAHSLYIEQLGELGIVGGGLLAASIAAMLLALARRARGQERGVWAALLAGGVAWAVHAGVDWDWEMPAVSAWFFAAGALALAAPLDGRPVETSPTVRFAIGLGCLVLAVEPVAVWRSQTELIKGLRAFERGDCLAAEHAALASNAALGSRPDPFELIGYCEAGAKRFRLALTAIRDAEVRDPRNWELRYSDALISAVAGADPRPAARAALVDYPTSPLTRTAARAFSTGGPQRWRRFALSAPLPVPRSRH
jgi:hypothetical protein